MKFGASPLGHVCVHMCVCARVCARVCVHCLNTISSCDCMIANGEWAVSA